MSPESTSEPGRLANVPLRPLLDAIAAVLDSLSDDAVKDERLVRLKALQRGVAEARLAKERSATEPGEPRMLFQTAAGGDPDDDLLREYEALLNLCFYARVVQTVK